MGADGDGGHRAEAGWELFPLAMVVVGLGVAAAALPDLASPRGTAALLLALAGAVVLVLGRGAEAAE